MKYDSNESMENTFGVALNGAITLTGVESGYTIYYSANSGASKDLTDSNNGWTTQVADYSAVKSYLIVIDGELAKAADISWNYNIQIPANLGYKNSVISNYKVYMKNNSASGQVEESKESPLISLETERGPELEATISSIDVENGGTITKGSYVDFVLKVKNTGSKSLTDVNIEIPLGDKIEIIQNDDTEIKNDVENKSIEIYVGELKPNCSFEKEIRLIAVKEGEAKLKFCVTTNPDEGIMYSNEYLVKVEEAPISLNVYSSKYDVTNGDAITVGVKIENLSEEALKNLTINFKLPEGIKYLYKTTVDDTKIEYDDQNNIVKIKINELQDSVNVSIMAIVEKTSEDMSISANCTVNGREYESIPIKFKSLVKSMEIEATNPGAQYVKKGDNVTSIFIIKNTGDTTIYDKTIKYEIPEGTRFVSATIKNRDKETELLLDDENCLTYRIAVLNSEEVITVSINLQIVLDETDEEQEINSFASIVDGEKIEKTDEIKYIMKAKREEDRNNIINDVIEDSDNNDDETGNEINGKVWIDANKNGKYDEGEDRLSGIKVLLIKKEDGEIELTTETNENGRYVFDKLKNDSYLVAFLYDTSKYVVTEYQKKGVSETINSDAIGATIKYNGKDRKVGLTDTITIKDENIRNIDIGLCEDSRFDLSLDKYISNVTVNNSQGIKTYNYTGKEKTLVKIDIPAKQMSTSTVIIEYTIVVRNEGTVPGYAKKIVDYLPDDLKFSSELNPSAYLGKDGNIYSEELAQTIINPGESREITIILTKKMTDTNTGTVVNEAEIAESNNDFGLKDINSEPNNKDEKENDLGSASIIITVKTGQVVIYTTLIVGVITMLAIGIYLIKKYVIRG